jgi:hypothetical protein
MPIRRASCLSIAVPLKPEANTMRRIYQ